MKQADVCVVGAGCVGLSAALSLAQTNKQVVVLDAGASISALTDDYALRVSAISLASQALFERLGIWQRINELRVTPYQHMAVRDKDSSGKISFNAADLALPALGHIIENDAIRIALIEACEANPNIELLFNTKYSAIHQTDSNVLITLENGLPIIASLLIACDGANSQIRETQKMALTFWDYDHHAIVATVKTEQPHNNTARQVFLPNGPLAFLPLPEANTHSIVWSTSPLEAAHLCDMDDDSFNKALVAALDTELGLCQVVSQRLSFPLRMRYARQWLKGRIILMGDAAHTIHPLAGLGMNLGLKDVAFLAELVSSQHGEFASHKQLRAYEMARKADAQTHIAMMQGLKELFEGNNPIKKTIRGLGLSVVDKLSPLKNLFAEKALGS